MYTKTNYAKFVFFGVSNLTNYIRIHNRSEFINIVSNVFVYHKSYRYNNKNFFTVMCKLKSHF